MSSVKGWEGAIRVATSIANAEDSGSDEPAIQSSSFNHGNNVEALKHLGSRTPTEVKEGHIDLSFDLTAEYQGNTTWMTRAGVGATGALTEYYIAIYPKGATATEPEIRLLGKFGDYDLSVDAEGLWVETVTFVGTEIDVGAAFIG